MSLSSNGLGLNLQEMSVGLVTLPLNGSVSYIFLFKIRPFALIFDHVSLECVWVTHDCCGAVLDIFDLIDSKD